MNREEEILIEMNLLREEYKFLTGAYENDDYYEEEYQYDDYDDYYDEDYQYNDYDDYYEEDYQYFAEEEKSGLGAWLKQQLDRFTEMLTSIPKKIEGLVDKVKEAMGKKLPDNVIEVDFGKGKRKKVSNSNIKQTLSEIGRNITSIGSAIVGIIKNAIKICKAGLSKDEAGKQAAKAQLSENSSKLKEALGNLNIFKKALGKIYASLSQRHDAAYERDMDDARTAKKNASDLASTRKDIANNPKKYDNMETGVRNYTQTAAEKQKSAMKHAMKAQKYARKANR